MYNDKELCPECGSMHTFLGPAKWFCMECGHKWTAIPQDSEAPPIEDVDKWIRASLGRMASSVPAQAATPKVGLPPVDEPHPMRERLEEPIEYRATAQRMMRDMGVHQTLSMRLTTQNFLHELTDWRIEERRWKAETAMAEMLNNLRKEACNE